MKIRPAISLSFVVAIFTLAACGKLLNSPQQADRTFLLLPLEPVPGLIRENPERVLRLRVSVVPGLDTDRLVTLAEPAELNQFSAARWPEHLPEFSRSLIHRSLRVHGWNSGEFVSKNAGKTACELAVEIERFYTVLEPSGLPGSVQIQWSGRNQCGEQVVQFKVSERVAVEQKNITGVVNAFQAGFDLAMRSMLRQLAAMEAGPQAHH